MVETQWWCIVGFCSVTTSKSQQLMTRNILFFSLMGLWITWSNSPSRLPLGSLSRTGSLQSTHFSWQILKEVKKDKPNLIDTHLLTLRPLANGCKLGLCDNLEGCDGVGRGREVQEGGHRYTDIADSCGCVAETNTIL